MTPIPQEVRLAVGSVRTSLALLIGGAVFGQGLAALAAPILARLYSPEEFGVFALYAALLSLLLVGSSLRYELAVPLPEEEETAGNLVAVAVVCVVAATILTAIGVTLLAQPIAQRMEEPLLAQYLWLLPVGLVAGGTFQVLAYWAVRRKQFGLLSSARGIHAAGQASTQTASGVLQAGAGGLIGGAIAGQLLAVSLLLARLGLRGQRVRPREWPLIARTYRNFPLFTTGASLVDLLGLHAPVLLFSWRFGLDVAGLFAVTMTVLGLPAVLMGHAAGQVFYAGVTGNQGDPAATRDFVERVSAFLLIISIPVFVLAVVGGPVLFATVLSDPWQDSGRFARYLAPWFAVSLVSAPLSTLTLAQGRQKEGFLFSLGLAATQAAGIGLGIWRRSPELATALFSGAGALVCTLYVAWVLPLAGSSVRLWLRRFPLRLWVRLGLLAAFFLGARLLPSTAFLVASLGALAAFYALLWREARAMLPSEWRVARREGPDLSVPARSLNLDARWPTGLEPHDRSCGPVAKDS